MSIVIDHVEPAAAPAVRPPAWLIAATATLAVATLVMAVAETSLWKHYLIDRGEYYSLAGLVFITIAGIAAHRQRRLAVSMPLALPWLLFPVITQGDQLIDHLTINQMRAISHVLLGALFAAPVAVVVIGVRYLAAPRVSPRASWLWGAALLAAEIWIAYRFLGLLMIVTLGIMIAACLTLAWMPPRRTRGTWTERRALVLLFAGVAMSFGLYVGYKNRPGAYQGSPAYYMDPTQQDAAYSLTAVAVPDDAAVRPPETVALQARAALAGYGEALERLLDGYYIADRNYNYAFHNALFLRHTPVLPDFRNLAIARTREAAAIAAHADAVHEALRDDLPPSTPLGALVAEAREYTAFNLRRAAILERMSGEFERTQAGLQHATHLYEGEGKVLGERLMDALGKHRAVLASGELRDVTGGFEAKAIAVRERYANRIVGF
ncbi:MAG TPA: hypothetical protein VM364_08930 [Vicinamibacterales bacterium]|nr:hypothetical protein [Vicinamibacterales bacterium]